MEGCKSVNTPIDCGVKLSWHDKGKVVDATLYKSLVGNLRYLTCIMPNILYAIGLVSRYMEEPRTTHWKTIKQILHYIRGTLSLGLFYNLSANKFEILVIRIVIGVKTRMIEIAHPNLHFTWVIRLSHDFQRNNQS
jgi:hypothetical protein